MALASLTFSEVPALAIQATTAPGGTDTVAPSFKINVARPAISIKNTIPNATAGGGDSAMVQYSTIAPSGTLAIDLTNYTNVAGQTAQSFARVKYFSLRVLSTSDDSVVPGTAASGVTIQPGAANGWAQLIGATAQLVIVLNGCGVRWANPNAAGWVVDGTHKTLTITNSDGALSAVVQIIAVGGST